MYDAIIYEATYGRTLTAKWPHAAIWSPVPHPWSIQLITLLWCSVHDCLLLTLCILCECKWVLRVSDHAFLNSYSCNGLIGSYFTVYSFVSDSFFSTTCVHFHMNICSVMDEKIKP